VKIEIDAGYRDERARFHLRLHCEDCALWDEARDACAHGYPTREHRRPERESDEAHVVFCKDFEVA